MLFSALREAMKEYKTVQETKQKKEKKIFLTYAPKCGQDLKLRVNEGGKSAMCFYELMDTCVTDPCLFL